MLVIKNAEIVSEDKVLKADIRIENGIIKEISENIIAASGHEVIDAKDLLLMPGGIDVHTHFDMPWSGGTTSDDFYTGTKAAIMGGTTSIIDYAEPEPGDTLSSGLKTWHEKSEGKSWCDYSFHMTLVDWNEEIKSEMAEIVEAGVNSFKIYLTDLDGIGQSDAIVKEVLERCSELGSLINCHCEDGYLISDIEKSLVEKDKIKIENFPLARPSKVEERAVEKFITLAKEADAACYVVHLSSKKGLDAINSLKEENKQIYVETCLQYLLLSNECYEKEPKEAVKYTLCPPLKTKQDNEVLWQGIIDGKIDTIATDHCSFNFKGQKDMGINDYRKVPNGLASVEHRVLLFLHYGLKRGLSLNEISKLLSTNPAKIFAMYPQKGVIKVGSDADLILINPNKKTIILSETQYQDVDYTPYENIELDIAIEQVFLRGKRVIPDGEAFGKFMKRKKGLCKI